MWLPLIPLYLSAVATSSVNSSIEDAEPACPPKKEMQTCTCSALGEVTILCRNLNDSTAIKSMFSRNSKWKIQKIHFDRCIMNYIPAVIFQYKSLATINVSSSILVNLFEETLPETSNMTIYMHDVKLRRDMDWKIFQNSNLDGLGTFNIPIKKIGDDFKEYVPEGIQNLWLENSNTVNIAKKALVRLVNLKLLTVTGGKLTTLDRDWFPRPFNVNFLNFNNQRIKELPQDIFEDFPFLYFVALLRNSLTTIDEKVFTRGVTTYSLERNPIECSCDLKWITTSGRTSGKQFYGTCKGPDPFTGKKINKLTENDFNFCE